MQEKTDNETVIEKRQDELLHTTSTNCTIDEAIPSISFPLDKCVNEQLFESDCWDDYLSDSETECYDGFGEKDKFHEIKRVWNDNLERSCGVCNYIENYTELSNMIKCEGYCRKPYHLKCVGLEKLPNTRWKCHNCLNNLVFCNACNSFSNKSGHNFLKCYHPICMRFFHTQCILRHQNNIIWTFNNSCGQKYMAPDINACMHPEINIGGNILKKIFGTENVEKGEEEVTLSLLNEFGFKFICDRHYCSSCSDYINNRKTSQNEARVEISRKKKSIFKLDDPDDLFYCIKCNSGYHVHCLHPDSIKLINGVCICYKHIHDQSDMILGRYDIKDEIECKLKTQLKNYFKLNYGRKLNNELKLALIEKIVNHLESSEFKLNSLPYELPGQSKDWLYIEVENLISENSLKDVNQKNINSLQNYGFTHIKRNIYIEDINESQDGKFEILSDTDHSEGKKKQREKIPKNNQKIKKKISKLNKKDKIFNEKCICRTICEKDTCQNAAMYIECNSNICGLEEGLQKKNCMNRIFNSNNNKFLDNQKKIILKNLKVIDTGEKGLGVTTNMTIPKDTFIIEYVGEVLTRENYLKRVEKYKKRELESRKNSVILNYDQENYDFNEDFVLAKDTRERHWYCMEIGNDYIIDSTNKGNLSRLINHSCDPNCIAQKWLVGNECRVGIFSKREIMPNEELTYDYSFTAFDIGFKCKCNSPSCKGRIGIENFKELNQELIKRRNLCMKSTMLNSFTSLNKSLFSNPIFLELDEIFTSRFDYKNDNQAFYYKAKNYSDKINKYNDLLHEHVINGIQIYPYDFKFRNSLYGYTSLLFFDSPDIISNWYFRKSKNVVLMNKPWIILPFAFNSREFTYLKYPFKMNYLKKQICKRLTIHLDQKNSNLSNNSIFWHLFDLGIGSDECCNICNNPGTLITCDYCYDSFHKYCLYNNEIPNNLKRSRLSYNYNKVEEKVKCRNCVENEFLSVYWLKTTYKRRRHNYFLKHKVRSIPSYINRINPFI
ncbi:PHD domains plus a SET domain and associated cysteine cluster [Cryptosporidium sp. chipmunk genotype I]|uniref:PHD domains plus a SET domain and associated cysteine cluster n=1 Tax=Cryptosporidium sp. chipmunk genotype I TaxID=1280935 RepID=UPI003519FD13|nr:PHD domains plus a SET domain and associated cysteine cluster [Cryptosporidium sp. chipmunk genotype I]